MAPTAPNSPAPAPALPQPAKFKGAGLPPPAIPARRYALPREVFRFFPKLEDETLHPTQWRLPPYLDNDSVPWLRTLKELYASPYAFPAAMSPEAGLMLFSLVRNIRPRVVVEVGTFIGISTIWLAAALEEGKDDPGRAPGEVQGLIHCFDDFGPIHSGPWRDAALSASRLPLVESHLAKAGLSHRVQFHAGDSSTEILKHREVLRAGLDPFKGAWMSPIVGSNAGPGSIGGVDFALVDGNHTVEGVLQDLRAIEPVLNTGGYIALHDTFPEQCGEHMGPRHILDHLAAEAQGLYEVCELYTAPLNYGMALLRRIG
jgi:hypothetical protein